jgi:murein DD-endopeptidase MepM/ murein hydrolase activator NlpD
MNAGGIPYTNIQSDPFDGMTMPIRYIPDWSKSQYQNKTTRFDEIPVSDYLPLPAYDPVRLADTTDLSRTSLIMHYTYITEYMGSYRLNYREYDGSHNGVDIRAPIGTPVLAVANGVVVRAIEADAVGTKFIVIRHDGINIGWRIQSVYSAYLHLSTIEIREGTPVRKGTMIGRVGMSGLATTPHLHIQIDTEDAPFHPYWPFTSADSRAAGLGFFDSINSGLGRENALKYSLHPINLINMFSSGITPDATVATPINPIEALNSAPPQPIPERELIPVNASVESIVAGMSALSKVWPVVPASRPTSSVVSSGKCEKKRFSDVSATSKVGKTLYSLVDNKCLFQSVSAFDSSATMSQREAITLLMQYYSIAPASGTSQFLDIAIGDSFQWYAIAAYRRGVLDGNYAFPDRILSREDFVELIVRIGRIEKNPSQIKIYRDITPMNVKYSAVQDYGFYTRARGGNFAPQWLLTRADAVELLGNVWTRDMMKK